MLKKAFIGIDTSNYTTSFSICDINGQILNNFKVPLRVKEGERGLRQSDAVFAHIKNFPEIAKMIAVNSDKYDFLAVGHSAFPRDVEGSYMPCFLVGEALSDMIASLYKIDNYRFSHQTGHIRASMYSSGAEFDKNFIAFHVSGGTTEILHVTVENNNYVINLIGGSKDLHAGQLIDRVGVAMGLQFPCGPKIEQLSKANDKVIPAIKTCVNGFLCNMSGAENSAIKIYEQTKDMSLVSDYIVSFVYKTIEDLTLNLREKYPYEQIVYAGGVMSNSIIQNKLKNTFENVYFASPEFSSDNASGIALLTREKFLNKEDENG